MLQIPGVPNVALLTGPLLLGGLFGYGLFGILAVQVFIYYHRFPRDPIGIKAVAAPAPVWIVFLVDILTQVLATDFLWEKLAAGWGDFPTFIALDFTWRMVSFPFLTGFVSSAMHIFFCWRIWKLQKSLILPLIISVMSLMQCGVAGFVGIRGTTLGLARVLELKKYIIVWLSSSAICDVLITVTMVTILFRRNTKSSFMEIRSVVNRMITLTVETGMMTTLVALIDLILFVVYPATNLHFIPLLMLSKLYSNTLMATLNARALFNEPQMSVRTQGAFWSDEPGSASSTSRGNVFIFRGAPTSSGKTMTEGRRHELEMATISNEVSITHDEVFIKKDSDIAAEGV